MAGLDADSSGTRASATIRAAAPADGAAVRSLLTGARLPLAGIPDDLADFLVAEGDGSVVGAIGVERYGAAALLRSAVVASEWRGTGVGERLVRALLERARANGLREIVLLTETAERWFPRFGFERIDRATAPLAVRESVEFKGACPDSAVVMRVRLPN